MKIFNYNNIIYLYIFVCVYYTKIYYNNIIHFTIQLSMKAPYDFNLIYLKQIIQYKR